MKNRLVLTDSSVTVQKEQSDALGTGFRCGFLGMLHMDVFVQRLEQEYGFFIFFHNPFRLFNFFKGLKL